MRGRGSCDNCAHWRGIRDRVRETGECRRYAPRQISGVGTGCSTKKWPETECDDYCGEWWDGIVRIAAESAGEGE